MAGKMPRYRTHTSLNVRRESLDKYREMKEELFYFKSDSDFFEALLEFIEENKSCIEQQGKKIVWGANDKMD